MRRLMSGFSWTRRARKRSIEQSGVRKQQGIDETWKRKEIHEDARKVYRTNFLGKRFGKMERRRHLAGHDLVIRTDRQGEAKC